MCMYSIVCLSCYGLFVCMLSCVFVYVMSFLCININTHYMYKCVYIYIYIYTNSNNTNDDNNNNNNNNDCNFVCFCLAPHARQPRERSSVFCYHY